MISSSSGLTRGNAAMIVARNAGVTSPKSLSTLSSSALFIFSSHSPPWEPYYRFAIGHHPNCGIASERQWISNNYQRQNFSQISSLSRLSWTTKNYLTDDTNIRQTKKYHTSAIIRQKEQHQKNLPKEQKQQQQQQQPPAPPSNLDNVHCHYTVLGITQTASSAEIKKAYHKMALKYHPDKNSEEGAADIFRRVKMAYEILGNDQTRISYDAERRRGGRR
mmetsp:Transcript_6084/g.12770  ORF Transcript_6084/g.12770 Transcript_6084/m.12770 type:complete len:220 (+) Transcript_6084:50-709(+)